MKTHQKEWMTIPILPCESIEETLVFWECLGFRITYKQTRPYQYGVIERGGYQLHFGRVKGMDITQNLYSGCIIMISDVEKVYRELIEKLKANLGKVSHSGIPRISRMKPGTTRFTLTDISGNSIIFINYGDADQETYEKVDDKSQSPLQRAIAVAIRFRDYKQDERAAAAILDAAFRKIENENKRDVAEALIIRIDLAIFMNDPVKAGEFRSQLNKMELLEEEMNHLKQKHASMVK